MLSKLTIHVLIITIYIRLYNDSKNPILVIISNPVFCSQTFSLYQAWL